MEDARVAPGAPMACDTHTLGCVAAAGTEPLPPPHPSWEVAPRGSAGTRADGGKERSPCGREAQQNQVRDTDTGEFSRKDEAFHHPHRQEVLVPPGGPALL